ncbi:MAG TPA: ABC transporter permease [bacterium]|nr:ABC transporter permease [bacterium]
MTATAIRHSLGTRARQFWAAVRLGWAIESNWTDPFVFFVYQVVRPLFGALILVVMYKVIRGGADDPLGFAQIYLGNAFFILVMQSILVIGFIVFEDRERYEMIRYVYLAPIGLGPYMLARGASHVAATSAAIILTLLLGVFGFDLRMHLALSELPYFAATMALGVAATLAMGLILAAATMLLAHHGQSMPEGVVGALFLLSGVVFPVDLLPGAFAELGRLLPWTYWLEGTRHVLLGAPFNSSLAGLSDAQILQRLALLTVGIALTAALALRGAQYLAIARGKLDEKTDH